MNTNNNQQTILPIATVQYRLNAEVNLLIYFDNQQYIFTIGPLIGRYA
jgi:hypothetical protein